MAYRVELRPAAAREFKRLSSAIQWRIRAAVERLADDPRPLGVKKLAAREGRYRIRVADHRIVYEIHDDVLVIMIFRIAHRRDVYR